MANVVTNDRLWRLDTVAVIVAVGTPVIVRKVVFVPAVIDDDVIIQEYLPDGTLDSAIILKANHTDVNLVSLDFGADGRKLNGLKLSTIDGGTLHVYLGKD
jgi:hypothetical protein